MERGLLWLPLLFVFFWLAWSGWNEYQKIEAYRVWAEEYDRAKYDIYSVLGQKGKELTWGKPTRSGPVNLATFYLDEIEAVRLLVNQKPVDLEDLPSRARKVAIVFIFKGDRASTSIPFTEISIAAEWLKFLRQELDKQV